MEVIFYMAKYLKFSGFTNIIAASNPYYEENATITTKRSISTSLTDLNPVGG